LRIFQNILLVIGAMALGTISCGPGLFYLMAVTVWQPRGLEFVMVIPLFSCGAALGTILGFAAGMHAITTRNNEAWKLRVWVGVAVGAAAGLAIRFANALPGYPALGELFQVWPTTAVLTAALGTLGGVVANFAGAPWDPQGSARPRQ
jgi:hypothetical protein